MDDDLDSFIDRFVKSKFEIHCACIDLFEQKYDFAPVICGNGNICGDERGFRLSLFVDNSSVDSEHWNCIRSKASEEDFVFKFVATDYKGRKWNGLGEVKRHRWFAAFGNSNSREKFHVYCDLFSISTLSNSLHYKRQRNLLVSVYEGFPENRLPLNKPTYMKVVIGDGVPTEAMWHSDANVEACGSKINLHYEKESNLLTVECPYSECLRPPFCGTYISEALTFVTAFPAYSKLSADIRSDCRSVISLNSIPKRVESTFPQFLSLNPRALMDVFALVVNYCSKHEHFELDPLFSSNYEVVLSSTGTYRVHIAIIGVIIEYLAMCMSKEANCDVLTDVDIEKIKDKLKGEREIDRIVGLLGMLKRSSPSMVMKELVKYGIIDDDDVKVWRETRHPSAHGTAFCEPLEERDIVNLNRLTSMYYKLSLRILGYRGRMDNFNAVMKVPPVDFQWTKFV